jgi:hypothetical protein
VELLALGLVNSGQFKAGLTFGGVERNEIFVEEPAPTQQAADWQFVGKLCRNLEIVRANNQANLVPIQFHLGSAYDTACDANCPRCNVIDSDGTGYVSVK